MTVPPGSDDPFLTPPTPPAGWSPGPPAPPPPSWQMPPPPPSWQMPPPSWPAHRWGTPYYDEPQPYHRIQRTRDYSWWRPLLGLPLVFGLWILVSVVGSVALLLPGIVDGSIVDGTTEELTGMLLSDPLGMLVTNLTLAAFIPITMLAMVALHQIRPTWLHSVTGRMRWGFLAQTVGVATVIFAAYFVLAAIWGIATGQPIEEGATGEPQLMLLLVVLLTTPLQAAGEEYAFRGYLMQALGSWVRHPAVPIVVSSLAFSAIHLGDLPSSVYFFSFGVVAAYLTYRTGGLEAAIGLHVVANTSQLVLLALSGAGVEAALDRSDTSWALPAVFGVMMLVYAAIVLRLARWKGLATRTFAGLAPPAWPR